MTSVHLIAGDQVADRYLPGGLIAVCGEVVDTSDPLGPDADPALLPGLRHGGPGLESAGLTAALAELRGRLPPYPLWPISTPMRDNCMGLTSSRSGGELGWWSSCGNGPELVVCQQLPLSRGWHSVGVQAGRVIGVPGACQAP